MSGAIFPRFLGVDGSGDFVWELENGRWTWAEDPRDAIGQQRTFEPERYIDKYGRPIGLDEEINRKTESLEDPAELVKLYARPTLYREATEVGTLVLRTMLEVLDCWIEGARANHDALDHIGESMQDECWTRWHPADIRSMVNDVAREFGLDEFPKPEIPKEDAVRS